MAKWKYSTFGPVYKSRRGDYQLTKFDEALQEDSTLVWTPEPINVGKARHGMVKLEIKLAMDNRLSEHPYWHNEPKEFVDEYTNFYNKLFGLNWLHKPEDRHNIIVNDKCCLTLVQYNNGTLHAYSRSTDMRNGYHADKVILDYLAHVINDCRPDCWVNKIVWYLAVPHQYVKDGMARLNEGETHDPICKRL